MPGGFRRKRVREQARLRVDLNGVMQTMIGASGLTDEGLAAAELRLQEADASPMDGLPDDPKAELRLTARFAEEVRGAFDDLVVVGRDATALVGHAIAMTLASPPPPGGLRLHLIDRLDPERLLGVVAELDLRRTIFDVVSASGDDVATAAHFLYIRDLLLKKLGAVEYKRHLVIATGPEGPLRQVVHDEGFGDLALSGAHEDDGPLLSAATLFPAACAGVDVRDLVHGALDLRAHAESVAPAGRLAWRLAGALALLADRGRRSVVVSSATAAMAQLADPFQRRLRPVAGSQPAATTGQVRVFLRCEGHRQELEVPKGYEDVDGLGYLGGRGFGELAHLQEQTSETALAMRGIPSLAVIAPELSAHTVGQLVALVESTARLRRTLLGPEAEPGEAETVVNGLRLSHGLAGRAGFEAERAEAQRWLARKEARYVV